MSTNNKAIPKSRLNQLHRDTNALPDEQYHVDHWRVAMVSAIVFADYVCVDHNKQWQQQCKTLLELESDY